MKTFQTMLKTELKLSIRDMNMIIFAIIMPLIIVIILGVIYGDKPAFEGADYTFMEQSFGAVCTIAVCAGGLMGLPILVADYREKKILKRFKVTPVSPGMILLVHLVIYSLYAVCSLGMLWAIAGIFFKTHMHGSILLFLISWFLVLISMLSIGMLAGGVAKNAKQASVIASALYFPMLVFSGATLPYEIMPRPLQIMADVMPLTQGIKILKATVLGLPLEGVRVAFVMMIAVSVICTGLSIKWFQWE